MFISCQSLGELKFDEIMKVWLKKIYSFMLKIRKQWCNKFGIVL